MLSFLSKFGAVKARQLGKSVTELIVRFDPETASEVQIREFEGQLNQLTERVAVLRREYDKERKEADAARTNYSRYMSAAEKIKAEIENPETSADRKASLEQSVEKLVTTIEGLVPEMEREIQEAEDARTVLEQFEDAAAKAAKKLTTARDRLKGAVRDMEKAKQAKKTAEEQAEDAAILAGLRDANDSLGTALSAMNAAAQKDRDAAEASKLKTDLLTKALPKSVETDQNVLDALGEEGTPSSLSLTDRLAALKARAG